MPFFSVILPIYNVVDYLPKCLDTIENQTYKDFEIIMVDDGSTDSSPSFCDEYKKNHENVKVVHKPNGGLSSARNAGLDVAEGEYIYFFDPDDWIELNALETVHSALLNASVRPDYLKFNYFRYIEKDSPVLSTVKPGEYIGRDAIDEMADCAFLSVGGYIHSAWSHVFKHEFIKEKSLRYVSEREIASEDFLFSLQAIAVAESIVVIDDCLYHYAIRGNSLTQKYKPGLVDKYTKLYTLCRDYYEKLGVLDKYEKKLNYLYAWSLVYSTVVVGEYRPHAGRTSEDGRKTVKQILKHKTFRKALINCPKGWFDRRKKIHKLAILLRCEPAIHHMLASTSN